MKYSPSEGAIHVEWRQDTAALGEAQGPGAQVPAIRILIRDEGVGIPEGELGAVFDRFVQSSTTNSGAGGTGRGLSICREIVQAHGDRIWAQNNAAGGAAFHLLLPSLSFERKDGPHLPARTRSFSLEDAPSAMRTNANSMSASSVGTRDV